MSALGRRVPSDWIHTETHNIAALGLAPPSAPVEIQFKPPDNLRRIYDQGQKNACVGFSSSWMLSILNGHQYDPLWIWNQAKRVDEWPDTNPGDNEGTSVRAGMDVLRDLGAVRVEHGRDDAPNPQEGISANKWATSLEDLRAAISHLRVPSVLGINWYQNFEKPVKFAGEWWIGRQRNLGSVLGGHAICCYGWSDKRQAIKLVQSWGLDYPDVWVPVSVVARLLSEGGECTMVIDRLHPGGEP